MTHHATLQEALEGYEKALVALHQVARAFEPERSLVIAQALRAGGAGELLLEASDVRAHADALRILARHVRAVLDRLEGDAAAAYDGVYRSDHV
jgi:hypothetical protein